MGNFDQKQYENSTKEMDSKTFLLQKDQLFQQYLENFRSVQFVGQVAVGSKKQVMKVIFDTGSSVLWFTNSEDPYASKKLHYDCNNAEITTTCKKSQDYSKLQFIQYGSGAVQGRKVSDTL